MDCLIGTSKVPVLTPHINWRLKKNTGSKFPSVTNYESQGAESNHWINKNSNESWKLRISKITKDPCGRTYFHTGAATYNLPPDSHLIPSTKASVTTLSPLNADKNNVKAMSKYKKIN